MNALRFYGNKGSLVPEWLIVNPEVSKDSELPSGSGGSKIRSSENEYKYDMESQSKSDDSHNSKQLAQPIDLTRQPKKGHQKIGNKKLDKRK